MFRAWIIHRGRIHWERTGCITVRKQLYGNIETHSGRRDASDAAELRHKLVVIRIHDVDVKLVSRGTVVDIYTSFNVSYACQV